MSAPHPADVIIDEHRTIARMLDVLRALAERVEAGQKVEHEDLRTTVVFFRDFVDLGHHEKEESVLIPELSRAGVDWNAEPLAKIRADHNQERYLVRSLRHSSLQETDWSKDDQQHFVSIANQLVDLQRAHLAREATHLIPLIRDRLPADRLDYVQRELATIDAGRAGGVSESDIQSLIARVLSGR